MEKENTVIIEVPAHSGIVLIANERNEQLYKHGKSVEYDRQVNSLRQLAGCAYAIIGSEPQSFPGDQSDEFINKVLAKPYRERIKIAGAMLAAELDRISNMTDEEVEQEMDFFNPTF